MITKQRVKKWTDQKKTNLFSVLCESVYITRKRVQDRSKEFLRNNNFRKERNKTNLLDKQPVAMIMTW